jgi:hypothetical protein
MDLEERKILYLRFGLALLKILAERKEIAESNKAKGIKDHKLISSLRKLAAASAIDYGTIQKISKGDQGLEFFTFIDIIDALELDMVQFSEYFYGISNNELKQYEGLIHKSRKEKASKKKVSKTAKAKNKPK